MAMAKRIFLFVTVNILVLVTINITASIIMGAMGVNPYRMSGGGLDLNALLIFCAIFGFTGAFISLAMSRMMAKWMMGVKVINPQAAMGFERDLLGRVHRLAQKAGLPAMPKVGIYESPEINAFATGPTRSRSLVAVSSGLLNRMDEAAVDGVLAHEIAHVANGDMVTMTLLQGVVNTFTMFLARVCAWAASQALAGNRDNEDSAPNPMIQYAFIFVFEVAFSLLGAIVVAWYSRRREFRADSGGAALAGREKMVHALQSLKSQFEVVDDRAPSLASFKINGRKGGLMSLFSSHPDMDLRIAALQNVANVEKSNVVGRPAY